MGYVTHTVIVVTGWDEAMTLDAANAARELNLIVTRPTVSTVNGYFTFMICPDGSKQGWDDRELADQQRAEFVKYLRSQQHDDGSSWLEWFMADYGSDDDAARIAKSPYPMSGAQ